MQIIKIYPTGFAANSYLVTKDGKRAFAIDPAQPKVLRELSSRGLTAEYVLLTHCHFDHIGGVSALQKAGAKVLCLTEELPLFGTAADLCEVFGAPPVDFSVDGTFTGGEEKTLCGITVRAIATAGHTSGSVCYLVTDGAERALFTGDTLFRGAAGRTDFPTGNTAALRASLQKLSALEGDIPIYAGHEEDTDLDTERRTNPFMQD